VIDDAIRTRLLAVAGVSDLVGTGSAARVWPMKLPQHPPPKYPAITYQLVSGAPDYDLDSASGLAHVRIQIDCWGRDATAATGGYRKARALAEAVRAALSGYSGTVSSVVIQQVTLLNRRVLHEDEAELYRESLDFEVWYEES